MNGERIKSLLEDLKRHEGWKIVIEILNDYENQLMEELLMKDDLDLNEVNAIKAKIWAIRSVRDVPDVITYAVESPVAGGYTNTGDFVSAVAEHFNTRAK